MFLPLEVLRVLTYMSRYIVLSGCVPPHSKGHKIVEGSVVVQHQPSSLCNRLEQSQLLVAVPVAMQQQVPTFQKFENSGSSTVTVLDKFVGFSRYFRHEHVHLSNCWQWLLLHSVVKLLGGRVLAKLGLRTLFGHCPTRCGYMTRFLFETFSGPDMYVAILVGAGHGQ